MSVIFNKIYLWQSLIGSVIGASAPFLLWWFAQKYQQLKEKRENLYYLQRVIVDQINLIIDTKDVINKFLLRLNLLLSNINQNPVNSYSVDNIFFPLFSARALPDDINKKSSGSGYIDNKIAKVYAMSKDLPHIINDLRIQLRDTLEMNQKIAFGRLNSTEIQKQQYQRNIREYKEMIKNDILEKNIPLYLKKLIEVLVAVREKTDRSQLSWNIKFSPKWRFYVKTSDYKKAKESLNIIDYMDKYFEVATNKQIEEIKNLENY